MSDIAEQNLSKEDIWKAHLMKAEVSRLSDRNYCLKHGLIPGVFRAYKKKLGFTRSRRSAPAETAGSFVRLVSPAVDEGVNVHVSKPAAPTRASLPDPAWLAELIRALEVTR